MLSLFGPLPIKAGNGILTTYGEGLDQELSLLKAPTRALKDLIRLMMIENMNMFNILSPSHLPACHSSYSPPCLAFCHQIMSKLSKLTPFFCHCHENGAEYRVVECGGSWHYPHYVVTPLTTALDTIVIIVYKADFHTLMLNVVCPSVSLQNMFKKRVIKLKGNQHLLREKKHLLQQLPLLQLPLLPTQPLHQYSLGPQNIHSSGYPSIALTGRQNELISNHSNVTKHILYFENMHGSDTSARSFT